MTTIVARSMTAFFGVPLETNEHRNNVRPRLVFWVDIMNGRQMVSTTLRHTQPSLILAIANLPLMPITPF